MLLIHQVWLLYHILLGQLLYHQWLMGKFDDILLYMIVVYQYQSALDNHHKVYVNIFLLIPFPYPYSLYVLLKFHTVDVMVVLLIYLEK